MPNVAPVDTAVTRAFHAPPTRRPYTRYSDRLDEAREAAGAGFGWEDLVVRFQILPRDAWKMVFGR